MENFSSVPVIDSYRDFDTSVFSEGLSLIRSGKVGVLIIAGGSATRAGIDFPKALVKFGPNNETLLELYLRKISFYEKVPVFIQVNDKSIGEITSYLTENNGFGVKKLTVFSQDVPLLTNDFKGSAKFLYHLSTKPAILTELSNLSYLSTMLIDNPVVEMLDSLFIGYMSQKKSLLGCKVFDYVKDEPCAKIVFRKDYVVPYTLDYKDDPAGTLDSVAYALPGINVFDVRELLASSTILFNALPTRFSTSSGTLEKSVCDIPRFYKLAQSLYFKCNRDFEFSPYKNASGDYSFSTAKKAFLDKYRNVFSNIFYHSV